VNKRKSEKVIGDFEPSEGEPAFFIDTSGQKPSSVASKARPSQNASTDEEDIQEELNQLISSLREQKQDEDEADHNSDSDY